MRCEPEPKVRGMDVVIIMIVALAFTAVLFYGALPPEEVIIERVSKEGVAKAAMIHELTGHAFPPEIAKWANINFSGTTVSIETQSINLWDGKKWK